MREERKALEALAANGGGERSAKTAAPAAAAQNGDEGKPKAKVARSKNAVREVQRLEREIEAAETALQELEQELADPAVWAEPAQAAASTERHTAAKRAVEELYARYERVAD